MDTPTNLHHAGLRTWVDEMIGLCDPDQVHWCDGSEEEYDRLTQQMVESGTVIQLNEELLAQLRA